MRYLKTYTKLFESVDVDLSDILLEINDENYWQAECWSDSSGGAHFDITDQLYKVINDKWIVIIKTVDDDEEYELEGLTPSPIVIESIKRAIDFMNGEGFTNYQITFENTDDIYKGGSAEFEEINLEDVPGLDVWPNNFIRIEFWNLK